MRQILKNIYYFFPVQLFMLHFRKYQVLLLFWAILFSAINGGFMKTFGVDGLFLAPEYLGQVNGLSASIVGVGLGMLIMAWNITTFILHSKRFKFLATTTRPFLKYCTNNSILPLLFLIFYLIKLVSFDSYRELMSGSEICWIILGLLAGLVLMLSFSLLYFFRAERNILRMVAPLIANPKEFKKQFNPAGNPNQDGFGMSVGYYFSTRLKLRKARSVSHYSQDFLDMIFKRHHFAAILSILFAFIFLVAVGFFMDNKIFQLPSAACIFILFAVLISVMGAFTYFLQSWSLLFAAIIIFALDILYQTDIIDPRNKAYGLNYAVLDNRPEYTKSSLQELCTPEKTAADKINMISILQNWKEKQTEAKPLMIFINVTGGGLRSATFTMNTLQQIDSITHGGLMQHTFLISGASGGMLAAAYYRELYRAKIHGSGINLCDKKYIDNIAGDLLNPVSTSLLARDIFAPVQKFTVDGNKYIKDRGYALEEKLNANTGGLLNIQIKDLAEDEKKAHVPIIIFNSVISRDGRKMMISTQPVSFMMKPLNHSFNTEAIADAVDFHALFSKQNPDNLRLLTALRMNATFPYILPNVWLPTKPVIDVMDAGLRDNFGQETTLRFIENFRDWIKANTRGVVILQLRDRINDNWLHPFEGGSLTDVITKPATMLQHNWQKLQDYYHNEQYSYMADSNLHRIAFMYIPQQEDNLAALNFHLTAREKRDVIESFRNENNQQALDSFLSLFNKK